MESTTDSDSSPSARLAAFVSGLALEDVPTSAVATAERAIVDTVGVTLAGSQAGAGSVAASLPRATGGQAASTATVLGRGEGTTVPEASFVNGTAGHALDFDDYTYAYPIHPSVTLVPPALALGEAVDATGGDAVTAYVAGYEALCYLTGGISSAHYERGWHATGTIGTLAAAAAAASMLDLDRAATRHALDVAASSPAGLQRNIGTHTKPMHAGQASRSGVTAALLAREGFTADPTAIAGEDGFFDLYCGRDDFDPAATPDLGEDWGIVDTPPNVKKYPSCGATHSSIAAATAIQAAHGFDAAAVEAVEVEVARFADDALKHPKPETGLQGKFSLEYCVATALLRDRVGPSAFEDDAVTQHDVQDLLDRVTVTIDDDLGYNDHKSTTSVVLEDGSRYTEVVADPPGTAANPLSEAELRDKFDACARDVLDGDELDAAYDRLSSLANQPDLGAVLAPM